MSAKVSSFQRVKSGDFDYTFFLVIWSDYETPITTELEKQFQPFGADLGPRGLVVQAFKQWSMDTYRDVCQKEWPADFRKQENETNDPFMLIINRDFRDFDPKQHPWGVIWFSEYNEKPTMVPRVLSRLAKMVRNGEDLFKYLQEAKFKQEAGGVAKLAKYVKLDDVKVLGVSIDAKAIIEDLGKALTG